MKDNWKEELAKDNYGNPARSISNLRLIFTLDENLSQTNFSSLLSGNDIHGGN